MQRIVAARYRPQDWNIYAAQASDGDNSGSDDSEVVRLMTQVILPVCQYFAYIEVGEEDSGQIGFAPSSSTLWSSYEGLRVDGGALAMRRVTSQQEIFPVFRDLFQPHGAGGVGAL